jgi:hypothetical protein
MKEPHEKMYKQLFNDAATDPTFITNFRREAPGAIELAYLELADAWGFRAWISDDATNLRGDPLPSYQALRVENAQGFYKKLYAEEQRLGRRLTPNAFDKVVPTDNRDIRYSLLDVDA